MITDYHIQLITRKMDELLAGQKELIDLLKAERQIITQTTQLEVTMEEQKTPESVTINEQGISTPVENSVPETPNPMVEQPVAQDAEPEVKPAKKKSPTAMFKAYRAAGGKLSWKKWHDAGMPEAAEVAQV